MSTKITNNNRHGHDTFLCFGGLDWWYQHRSHVDFQLTRRFARMGKTIYVNSIVMQKPNFGEGKKFIQRVVRKVKSIMTGLKMSDAGFWVYSPFSMPVHHIPWAKYLNEIVLLWQLIFITRKVEIENPYIMVVCPAACNVALRMKKKGLAYLRTDVYELFPNVDSEVIRDYDRRLKQEADVTLFVSRKLYSEESAQCKNPFFLDHGVDYELFTQVENDEAVAAEMGKIPHPIIGFFGTIDSHTVDIGLIEEISDKLHGCSIVLIGKEAERYSGLYDRDNIYMLGIKEYERIPAYGEYFDVAIMPWQKTQWIDSCNPIKLKEYLALGKPVVSTPFSELEHYSEVVYVGRTTEDFVEKIQMALDENSDQRIAARRERVRPFTWDSKADQIMSELLNSRHLS